MRMKETSLVLLAIIIALFVGNVSSKFFDVGTYIIEATGGGDSEETVNASVNRGVDLTFPKTDEYGTKIATSYCNVLRKQEKLEIGEFSECVNQQSSHSGEVYKAMTGEVLNQSWSALESNEKALVLEEVLAAEQR